MSAEIVAVPILLLIVLLVMTRARRILSLLTRPQEEVKDRERKQPVKAEVSRECPNCGGTMETGYLIAPQGITWSRVPIQSFFPPIGEPLGFFPLARGRRSQCFRAYRCQRCGIIQVDLNEEQPFGI
jgi:hypothetical protein